MGLHLHRSERADALVLALANVLGTAPPDPFRPDVVAVPARGIERWLTQRLSHHLGIGVGAADGTRSGGDGVCANVRFPAPAAMVAEAVAAATGVDPALDAWQPARSTWTLLDLIDAGADEPWCADLRRHLATDTAGGGRRYALAERVADLFASYAEQRPAMLRDWAVGHDTDGAGADLDEDLAWQAELWRRLRRSLGTPSPAERLDDACGTLRAHPDVADLPDRLSLFGPTRLSTEQAIVLAALAEHRDVHLWLPHPSAVLWDHGRALGHAGPRPRRRRDPTTGLASHPLLSSLGRDAREMQLLLTGPDAPDSDRHHQAAPTPATLLGRLQHDLRTDTAPPGRPVGGRPDRRALHEPRDRSLQVHACHGRARQVEVLREVLLGLLAADPTLEPRHVVVMCPDIESYAALISATFGLAGDTDHATHPGHRLRVRLADRSLRQTNPLLSTLARMLELADARVTASQLLDFAALPPVRRRFRLTDDDLERLRGWVSGSGVRWGLDAAHREPYGLQAVTQNTWRAGLDRILLGAAMSEDELCWFGSAVPLDDVDSTDTDLAGRFAELLDRFAGTVVGAAEARPLRDWLDHLLRGLDALTSVDDRHAWQLTQVRRELADLATAAADRADRTQLRLADVRALLADRLRGRPTRAGFRTGNLTMCSMVPMRSVPHRVVCLLGMDDGVFPRTAGVDGDDVLARDPLVGERDRRSEDRQLLLDAVLAAEEHLVVLYTGADERTNAVRPPAVPLGEILDVVDGTVRAADGRRARDHVVVRHPLQPFDARNFTTGVLGAEGPFSFDPAGLAGAVAASHGRHPSSPLLDHLLDPVVPDEDEVALDQLVRFFAHPVREYLRQRLGVSVRDEESDLDDALTTELDALGVWRAGDRWVRHRLAGVGADALREAERLGGWLPPGALGARVLEASVADQAEPIVAAAQPDRIADPAALDVVAPLPSGVAVRGTVSEVHGDTVRRTEFSRLGPKHRLGAWVQLLALAAARPDRCWRAVTIGRGAAEGAGPACSTLTAPPASAAAAILDRLVAVYLHGLRRPVPLVVESHAYAAARRAGKNPSQASATAETKWREKYGGSKDRHHQLVWGPQPDFEQLLAEPPDPGPVAAGRDDPTWFGALAQAVWQPLFDAEERT